MQTKTSIAFLAVLLALAGCDGSPPADPDAGPIDADSGMTGTPDAGTRDSGPAPAEGCDAARAITLTEGEQTITGNTTGMGSGEALSDGCGSAPAPQEVLALTVPGTGTKDVFFVMGEGTAAIDTVVEVRTGACESAAEAQCFDDGGGGVLSAGAVLAEGGSTVYLLVTGYAATDAGAWSLEVSVADATAPTLTGGDALRVGTERYEIFVDGGDAEGNAAAVRFSLLDADGDVVGIDFDEEDMPIPDVDGTPDLAEFEIGFTDDLDGQTTFSRALVRIADPAFVTATAAATQLRLLVLDVTELTSAEMTFAIRDVTEAGRGETCGADAICADGYECSAVTCQIPAGTVTFCAGATALTVTPAAPVTQTGTLEPGDSRLAPSCVDPRYFERHGPEALYTVTVPAPESPAIGYDLIAATDNVATEIDTVVYLQSECGDPATEVACNDDADFDGEVYQSRAIAQDAPAGTYTIAVENLNGPAAAVTYQLDVSLRPVLGAGATCDPAGVMNRCSTGACPAGDSPVCPAATPPVP
jgi:hypothetical protein